MPGCHRFHLAGGRPEAGHGFPQIEAEVDGAQRVGDQCAHVRTQGIHHLCAPLHQRDLQTEPHKGFCHFQADITPADNHHPPRLALFHGLSHPDAALCDFSAALPHLVLTTIPPGRALLD